MELVKARSSPGLHIVFYCFDLFEILKNSGFGCHISGVFAGIFGYSDDDLLLSPTVSGLQQMITITESYSNSHGLKFSTDQDPSKSKTKCISWMHRPRPLPRMRLCGNLLPWVRKILHLGITITDDVNMLNQDMKIKNARYVGRNIEINQEFYFAANETKMKVNEIYNSSWFGSVLWDLFCPGSVQIESSYNRSIKIMMSLPYATHRGLIEPISGRKHLKRHLIKRFLQMLQSIRRSAKPILRTILAVTENNTNSVTGRNLRSIMLLTGRDSISEITPLDAGIIQYHTLDDDEGWRIEFLKCLLVERDQGSLEDSDLEWLEWLCTD